VAEEDDRPDAEERPLTRKEAAPLKFVVFWCVLVTVMGAVYTVAVVGEPRLRSVLAFIAIPILLGHLPLGIGIALRQEWARILFFWLPFLLFATIWPMFSSGIGAVAYVAFVAVYMVCGNHLLQTRIKSLFR